MAFIKHLLNDSVSLEGTFVLNGSAIVKSNGTEAFSGDQSMGGFQLLNVGTAVLGTSAVNKDYVDNFVLGLSWKTACVAATTANIVLSGLLVIDGVTLVVNDRVLVKNQTLPKDNGIYVAAAGAWTRATDADTAAKLESAAVAIKEGLTNADTRWTQTNDNFIIGTDPITWVFIGKGSGVVAATFVVSTTPNVGDYTDIQSAIDALPAAGGLILVREGTYSLSSTIVMPDKPVAIRGCGESTVIDIGVIAIAAFTIGFDRPYVFSDFTLIGSHSALPGQSAFSYTGAANALSTIHLSRVRTGISFPAPASTIHTVFYVPGSFNMRVDCTECYFQLPVSGSGGVFNKSAAGAGGALILRDVVGRGSTSIFSTTNFQFQLIDSDFDVIQINAALVSDARLIGCVFTNSVGMTFGARAKLIGCSFGAGCTTLTFADYDAEVVGCSFSSVIATHISSGVRMSVVGCSFQNWTTQAISLAATDCTITGNLNCKVTETVGADSNRYANNTGFSGSTIIGPNSVVEGVLRKSSTGVATSGSFVVVFTHTSLRGLLGIGTIKNTGADAMEVKETVTDLFGVTDSVTTSVLVGNSYMLDPQTNFTTARPPYASYQVEVRHTATATTYSLRHASHGVS